MQRSISISVNLFGYRSGLISPLEFAEAPEECALTFYLKDKQKVVVSDFRILMMKIHSRFLFFVVDRYPSDLNGSQCNSRLNRPLKLFKLIGSTSVYVDLHIVRRDQSRCCFAKFEAVRFRVLRFASEHIVLS